MLLIRYLLTIFILFAFIPTLFGQAPICPADVPNVVVNLTSSPSAVWTTPPPGIQRDNKCCTNANSTRCIEFIITLHPNAQGISFTFANGAVPTGSGTVTINCGPPVAVSTNICLNGVGPHHLVYCKPGGNDNDYKITSIAKPSVSPPTVVSDGCTGRIFATGFIESSILWRSVPNNPVYDTYLSATSGQDSVTATFQPGAPSFIDYEVCGLPTGSICSLINFCDTVRVQFVSTLDADIQPKNGSICFGSVGTTLTANGTGGLAPYTYLWNTGATTQSIIAVNAGTYSVTIDDATSCPIARDTVVVTAFPSTIVANAGPDRTECNNTSPFSVALSGSVTAATGGIWSSTGTGTFSPNNTSLTASYLPSAAEIAAGRVLLTLTTTGNGTCPADTDQVYIRISNAPVVDAGNPISKCFNNSLTQLNGSVSGLTTTGVWTSSGAGIFTPNNTTLNATYSPTLAERNTGSTVLTLTSTNNGICTAVSDNVTITYTPAPVVNAGLNQTKCKNNPNVLLNGSVTGPTTTGQWSSNGTGTFVPNNTALNATYIPSQTDLNNGTVFLSLSSTNNGNCNAVFDEMTVTFTNAPIVNAGADITRCRNNLGTINLNGSISAGASLGIWTSPNGTGSFSPNNTSLNAIYIPSQSDITNGSITLILTSTDNSGGSCNAVSDTMLLTILPSPIVNAGSDLTACANNISFNLNGSVTGTATSGIWSSSGTGTFNPNNSTLNASYIPSIADINSGVPIRIVLSSNNGPLSTCNVVTDTLFLNITPAPIVNAGLDFSVCASNPTINLSGSISAGANAGTWSTTNGSGTFSPNNSILNPTYNPSAFDIAHGLVIFVLTSSGNSGGSCNAVTDTVRVTITPRPVVNAGANITRCRNNIGTISLTGTVSGGASTGSWSTSGTGTFSSLTNLTTTYLPSASDIASNSPILIILESTGNSGGLCTPVFDTLNLNFTPQPIVNAGSNSSVCANNIVGGIAVSGTISGGASTGIWSTSGTGTFSPNATTLNATYNPSISDINAGTVTLTLTSTDHGVNSCALVSASRIITINPVPVVDAGSNQTVCSNSVTSISLNGSVTGGANAGTWTTNGSGSFANAGALLTSYTLSNADKLLANLTFTLTSSGNSGNTCIPVNDNFVLTILQAPNVSAGPDQVKCFNNATVNLSGNVSGITNQGIWSSPNGTGTFANSSNLTTTYTPSLTDKQNGSVLIVLSSNNGPLSTCLTVRDTLIVTFTPSPVVNAGANQTVCANNSIITLSGIVSGGASAGSWTTIAGTGIFSTPLNLTTTYTPSANDILNGSVQFVLTSTGNTGGSCNAVSDTLTVTITPSPIVNAGSNISRCVNNIGTINLNGSVSAGATAGIWTSSGTGTFFPNNTVLNATYVPSTNDINNGSVQLILSSTGNTNGTCAIVRDTTILAFTPRPNVNAGSNQTVCFNNVTSINLTGTVTGGASAGIWSTSGTGSFGNINALSTTYTPSLLDKNNGSVILTLTSDNGPLSNCAVESSTLTLTILPRPIVNAGPNQTMCSSTPSINLNGTVIGGANAGAWTTNGTGTFLPNNSSLIASYHPSAADISMGTVQIILSSTGNSGGLCNTVNDTMLLIINPSTTVNAGADQPICKIKNSIQLNGTVSGATTTGVWTTNGTGTFSPNTKNGVYFLSPTDTLQSSLTFILVSTNNGICGGDLDTMIVTFSNSDDASFTYTSGTYCKSDPLLKTPVIPILATGAGGVFTSSPAGLILNSSTGAVDVQNSALGTYTVKFVTNGPCPDSSTVILNIILNTPNANFSYPGTFCKGNTNAFPVFAPGASAGFFTASSANIVFISQNTGEIDVYNSIPGTYTITNTIPASGTCAGVTANNTITIDNWVRVTTSPNSQTVCANNSAVNLQATLNAGPVSSGTWKTNGDGNFTSPASTSTIYNPGPNDKSNGSVQVRFVSDNPPGVCDADSVTILINITPAPIVNAGVNDTICATSAFIQLNGIVSAGATRGRWTSNGTGSFLPNDSTLNAQYIYSNADKLNGTVTLVLTSIGNTNNTCIAVTDTVVYKIDLDPVVSAGVDQNICFTKDTVQLNASIVGSVTTGIWSSSGTGTFIPNNTTINAKYILSNADKTNGPIRLILSSNVATSVCSFVKDTMFINIGSPLNIDAGPNKIVCNNNASVGLTGTVSGLTNTGIWRTAGDGIFTGGATNLTTVYEPGPNDKTNGTVLIRLVSTGTGICGIDSDFVQLNITPSPIVNAGSNITVCKNNISINLNGTVTGGANTGRWTSTGTGTFLPNDSILTASYIPSQADINANTVQLILSSTGNTNNTCLTVRDTLIVNFSNSPSVAVGIDKSICRNNIIPVSLTGVLGGSITKAKWTTIGGDGSFSPNDSNLNASYTLGANDILNGSVTIVLRSADHGINSCLAASDTLNIFITPSPVVNAGINQTVCANTIVQLNGIINGGANAGVWSTDNGTGSFNPNNTSLNGTYTPSNADVILGNIRLILTSTDNTNNTCLAVSDTFILNFTPVPIVDAGANQTVCADVADVSLVGSVTGTTTNGIWSSTGTGTFNPSNTNLNTQYIPSATDTSNGSVKIYLTSQGGIGTCINTVDSLIISFTPAPIINAGINGSVCANNNIIQLNGSVSGASNTGIWTSSGNGTFNPSNSNLTATYTPSASDLVNGFVNFTLKPTNIGTCILDSNLVQFLINPSPIVDAGANQSLCSNVNTVNLSGSVSVSATKGRWTSTGTGTFSPHDSALNAIYNLSTADRLLSNFKLYLTSTDNTSGTCLAVRDSITITLLPSVLINLTDTFRVCANNSVVNLTPTISGTATQYTWSTNGSGTFLPNNTSQNALYIPSFADTANGIVKLTLSIGNLGGCLNSIDSTILIISPSPNTNAGQNITVCFNNDTIQLNGSVTAGATAGSWSSNGTGVFIPNANALNARYVPSLADKILGSIRFVLSSTGNSNNTCVTVRDTIIATISPTPIVDAGINQVLCANNAQIQLNGSITAGATTGIWTSTGSGTFSPNNSALNAIYTPSNQDLLNGSVRLFLTTNNHALNLCNLVQDSVDISFTPAPLISLLDTMYSCITDNSVFVQASISQGATSGFWTSLGSGSFSPNNTDLSITYIPSAQDKLNSSVQLVLNSTGNTGGLCLAESDTISIIFTPLIFMNNDDTIEVCKNTIGVNLTGAVSGGSNSGKWISNGTGQFLPNDTSLTVQYVFSTSDTSRNNLVLTLQSTNNGGCDTSESKTYIQFIEEPFVYAGPDINICSNSGAAVLSGFIAGGASKGIWTTTGSGTFSPNDTTLNATYIPSTADFSTGDIVIRLTTRDHLVNNCNLEFDEFNVHLYLSATVNAGPDRYVCYGDTATQLIANANGANPFRYFWSTGDTTADILVGPGTYYIRIQDINDCIPTFDTVVVYAVDTIITANAGPDNTVCISSDSVQLNGTVLGINEGYWKGNGTFSPDSSALNAVYYPTSLEKAQGFFDLILIPSDKTGCTFINDSVRYFYIAKPNANIVGPGTICLANSTSSYQAPVIPGVSYLWTVNGGAILGTNDSNIVNIIWSTAGGNLSLIMSNATGCDSIVQLNVQYVGMNKPNINGILSVCNSSAFQQTYSVANNLGSTYTWSVTNGSILSGGNSNSITIQWNGSGSLILVETGSLACEVRDTLNFVYNPLQASTISPTFISGCAPLDVDFNASTNNPEPLIYKWIINGDTLLGKNQSYRFDTSGNYSITYILDNGICTDTMIANVVVFEDPVAGFNYLNAPFDSLSFPNDTLFIQNLSDLNSDYLWDFGDGTQDTSTNPIHKFTREGIYQIVLRVTDRTTGCVSYAYRPFKLEVNSNLNHPNVFTPNGDGVNDKFRIYEKNLRNFKIIIFNRWGQKIYTSTDPFFEWDGTHNGNPCIVGTYVFYIVAKGEDDTPFNRVGHIYLVR